MALGNITHWGVAHVHQQHSRLDGQVCMVMEWNGMAPHNTLLAAWLLAII